MTLQGIYYAYPSEDEGGTEGLDPIGVETDYFEANIGASHTFEGQLAPSISANYYFSPDTYGEDGNAHTVQGGFGLTLPGEIGFYANIGYSDIEGDESSGRAIGLFQQDGTPLDGYDWVYFSVGVNKVFKGFKFDLGYHGTDESDDLETFYGPPAPPFENYRELIEGEFVFTVSRSF